MCWMLTEDSVTGLNLDDPMSAGKVIKPWDDRLDELDYIESGVDDEVSTSDHSTSSMTILILIRTSSYCIFHSHNPYGQFCSTYFPHPPPTHFDPHQ